MDKFRALYAKTPLMTMKRDPGPEGRWSEIYGQDFGRLVNAWMAAIKT